MPMRIFENRNRSGTYLVMLVVGAAMFGMFYFITFFVQGVRDYGPLKTGVAFLPVAFTIGIVSQVVGAAAAEARPQAADDHRDEPADRVAAVAVDRQRARRLRHQAAAGHAGARGRDGLPVRAVDLHRGVGGRQHRRRARLGAAQRRPAGRRRARPVGDDDGVRHVRRATTPATTSARARKGAAAARRSAAAASARG